MAPPMEVPMNSMAVLAAVNERMRMRRRSNIGVRARNSQTRKSG